MSAPGPAGPPPGRSPPPLEAALEAAFDHTARLLADARSILFITGAGVSADSGLPTYRGIGGLYEDADTDEGLPIEEVLSGPMLARRPELVWRHIASIEAVCRGVQPNRAHQVIAQLERRRERVVTLTQNVDGLHGAAGAEQVIEIHGNIHTLRCTGCDRTRAVQDYAGLALPPRCGRCAAVERPEVVLFGELLPPAAVARLQDELDEGFELVVSVGTSSLFPYIAGPVFDAARRGTPTVEINPGETVVSGVVDVRLTTGAAAALGELARRLGL